jgi:hypothetical protein
MPRHKLSDSKLLEMVDGGLSYQSIGDQYGISRQAIQKRMVKLRGKMVAATCATGAKQLVDNRIDVLARLREIHDKTLGLIETAEGNDDYDLMLKSLGEVRQQLRLCADLLCMVADVQNVQNFQKAVLEAIGEADEPTQRKIIESLNRAKSLRESAQWRIQTVRHTDSE